VPQTTGFFDAHKAFALLAPDGSTVLPLDPRSRATVALPQTGTYQVFVDDAGDITATGAYQFGDFPRGALRRSQGDQYRRVVRVCAAQSNPLSPPGASP
jgi:hypothetical protein